MLKHHKVVMLPTNQEATNGLQPFKTKKGLVLPITGAEARRFQHNGFQGYHLYIIDPNASIEVDDWCIEHTFRLLPPYLFQYHVKLDIEDLDVYKIIASTDLSLSLPSPSAAFIAKYVELEGKIEDVMVEYNQEEITMVDPPCGWQYGFPKQIKDHETIHDLGYPVDGLETHSRYWTQSVESLKVSSDNTITIKPYKDSFTRKEVEELLKQTAEKPLEEVLKSF